ncbi:hypothetical protein E2562_031104 [Oryza meyeriana var. granulata]|uniref:Uncharacterized protein n=1 Tax=Oryza meyeriana var. granulata TaxID=110450 RepID=A0A6G1CL45_9ORYZ|nr:hypothetical protein E2562_031104 [Oryza meyeriana var. granulata]
MGASGMGADLGKRRLSMLWAPHGAGSRSQQKEMGASICSGRRGDWNGCIDFLLGIVGDWDGGVIASISYYR